MVINLLSEFKKISVLFLIISCFAIPLFAAEKIEISEEELKEEEGPAEEKWQVLEWQEDYPEYVLKYGVVIESYDVKTEEWKEERHVETDGPTPSIQLNPRLGVGRYRYKIITFDLIGLSDVESEWFEFNIYRAFMPEINGVNVNVNKSSTIYFDEFNDGIVFIDGKNLFDLAADENDLSFTTYSLQSERSRRQRYTLEPRSNKDNKEISFFFDLDTIDTGVYNIVATDASGLKSEINQKNKIVLKFKKAVDFDLSAGYMFPVVLFDDTFNKYLNSSIFPLSVVGKATFIPFKRRFGYMGIGIEAYYTRMDASFAEYKIGGNEIAGYLNFVYQLPIKNKKTNRHWATLELHAGAGIDYMMDFKFKFPLGSSPSFNGIYPSIDAGGSVAFYVMGRLFVEANVDFCMAFMKDMGYGVLRPGLMVGWQF